MKIIVLLPIKNEEWILPYTLKNFSSFADSIIIADQQSTDSTREICARFEKVKVIENPYEGHSNKIRWLLLDEARKIEGKKLIVCLDADELISPFFINEVKKYANDFAEPVAFSALWLQLYSKGESYRTDGPWKTNSKQFAWLDDLSLDYVRTEVINDHTSRIPEVAISHHLTHPILHLQYLAQKRCEIKQAWYMCRELQQGINPRKINNQYSVAKFTRSIQLGGVDPTWFDGVQLPSSEVFETYDETKLQDILHMFKVKGVQFFEPLDIWHIQELKDVFIDNVGRVPKPKLYPTWLIYTNNLKNKLRNGILKTLT